MRIYFATPYASWERGTNENTNGLIRRTFPPGTNFLQVTHKQLDDVVSRLNHRPRQCLRTPLKTVLFRDGGVSRVLKSSCIRPYTPVFPARLPCPHQNAWFLEVPLNYHTPFEVFNKVTHGALAA